MNFAPDGTHLGMLDANAIMVMIDHLILERGLDPVKYITTPHPRYTAGE
jgi:hypothetical protein